MDIQIVEGAGAYICGEESALMDSIEGKRGEPRYKPPFPPMKGLFGYPTIINNVETLVNIPRIMLNGAGWFRTMGTEKSRGTKVFSVSGDVERPGVYELLMGSPLKELVVDLAGAQEVKAVQIGGASGRILPAELLDTPLAFEQVMGSGAVIVLNRSRDMIDMVFRNIDFFCRGVLREMYPLSGRHGGDDGDLQPAGPWGRPGGRSPGPGRPLSGHDAGLLVRTGSIRPHTGPGFVEVF